MNLKIQGLDDKDWSISFNKYINQPLINPQNFFSKFMESSPVDENVISSLSD